MKIYLFLLSLLCFASADELAMFDIIDEQESSFEDEKPFIDANVKLNYRYNENLEDDKVLFVNLKKDTDNFLVDMRIVGDDETQRVLLKELYVKGEFLEYNHFKVGRINIKEGYAKGFNPSDYFRDNPSVTLSTDPKEQKDNRLGSLGISWSSFLDEFVFRALYTPKIETQKHSLLSDKKYFGLRLDETNAQTKASLYLSYSGVENLNSSIILHHNDEGLNLGLNLSYIYSEYIFYIEASLKEDDGLFTQTTLGITHTSSYNIVTSLEYSYDEDNDNYKSIFLNSRASDVAVDLDINFIMQLSLEDYSSTTQLGLEYAYSDSIQTDVVLSTYMGNKSTFYGRLPNNYELLLELKYFF